MEMDNGLHVYGPAAAQAYAPMEITVVGTEGLRFGEPQFPHTKPFRIDGIDQEFEAYEGSAEIIIPVTSTIRKEGTSEVDLRVSYQACTDAMCYLPQTESLHLTVPTAPD